MRRQLPLPGARAALLGRYSSEMQNPRSADDQIRVGEELCQRHGWTVVVRAKDEARTGRTTVGRTGLWDVLAAAEAGQCDVVVVEDISRIARNAADMLMIARKLDEFDVVIVTFEGGVMGGIELTIRAQMAEDYSKDLAVRVRRGHASAAKRGRVIGGLAYGYRLLEAPDEHGSLRAVDEAAARVVRRVYEDLRAGVSPDAICAALNREGVPPPSGKLWRPKAITGDKRLMTGIGRNPLYAGRLIFGKSKTKLITSTGKVKVSPAHSADYVVTDVPHLRIVSDELWQAAQEVLDARSCTVPNNARNPTYLLSRKLKCGACGQPVSMVGESLGCTGRRYGTGCTNRRRVAREDVERVVLEGIPEKILQPHILNLYLDEYRREVGKAVDEYIARADSTHQRKEVLDRQIANLMEVAKAGGDGLAAQMLHDELSRLAEQRKQLERAARSAPPLEALSLETEDVIDRLKTLLSELGEGLNGPERDAARARDIIRSFIREVRITPLEDGRREDRRGAGPVRVTVEGSLTELLGHAYGDRVIQRRGTNAATLDLPTVVFEYYVDVTRKNSARIAAYADVAQLSRMLDDAYAPVRHNEIIDAFDRGTPTLSAEERHVLDQRARRAVEFLSNDGLIRSVRLADGAGWVWDDRQLSNAEWRARAAVREKPAEPIGIFRVSAPQAFVVVVGPSQVAANDGGDQ